MNFASLLTPMGGLAAISLLASLIYGFVFLQSPPSALRTIAKTVAVGAIAVMAWLSGQGWLLAFGMTLSAFGDAFLAADPKRWLPFGLVSFLLAHAAYLVVFIHSGGGVLMFRSEPVRLAGVLAALSAAVLIVRYLGASPGPMQGPVLVYVFAITVMVLAACALPWFRWPAMAGAAAFMSSDGILAVRLFKFEGRPNRLADLAVWWLYYGAQVGIAAAFLFSRAQVLTLNA